MRSVLITIAGSSNGRIVDSESIHLGSNPSPAASSWIELVVSKFSRASRSEAYCVVGLNSIRRFLRKRFEPKIFLRHTLFRIRSSLVAAWRAMTRLLPTLAWVRATHKRLVPNGRFVPQLSSSRT